MANILAVFCLVFVIGCTFTKSTSNEDWGLTKRGWTWFNWYYYWYWRHGAWGKVSDHDTISQRLWGVDHSRIHHRVDYGLLLQRKVLKNSSVDRASRRLFRYLKLTKIRKKTTYRTFTDLLYNFQPSIDGAATPNAKIKENIEKFLSGVMKTRVFQELYWYLVRNTFVYPDKAQFKETLSDLWFNKANFTAEKPSAFQKVFVGDSVNNPSKLSVRNWLQFYILELTKLNYYGYVRYFQYDPKVISVMFSWNRGVPVTDYMLIGTSPEFELALYTLCYFRSPGTECECKINNKNFLVKTVLSADGTRLLNANFELKL